MCLSVQCPSGSSVSGSGCRARGAHQDPEHQHQPEQIHQPAPSACPPEGRTPSAGPSDPSLLSETRARCSAATEQTLQLWPPLPRGPMAVSCLASSFLPLPSPCPGNSEAQTCLPEARWRETTSPLLPFKGASLYPFSPWISQGKKAQRGPRFSAWTGHSQIPERTGSLFQAPGLPESLRGTVGLLLAPNSFPLQREMLCQLLSGLCGGTYPQGAVRHGASHIGPLGRKQQWKPDTWLVSDVHAGPAPMVRLQPSLLVLSAGEGVGAGRRASEVTGCDVTATPPPPLTKLLRTAQRAVNRIEKLPNHWSRPGISSGHFANKLGLSSMAELVVSGHSSPHQPCRFV